MIEDKLFKGILLGSIIIALSIFSTLIMPNLMIIDQNQLENITFQISIVNETYNVSNIIMGDGELYFNETDQRFYGCNSTICKKLALE